MQIALGAAQNDLAAADATQTVAESRRVGCGHAGVRNRNDVAFELVLVGFEEGAEVGAANFFFALK